jgi:hypothetical protein
LAALLLLMLLVSMCDDTGTDATSNNTSSPQTEVVTGRNVRFVQYKNNEGQGCHFVEDAYGKWSEQDANNGVIAQFQEVKRDDNSVYLRDESRGVTLQLNVKNKKVTYSDDIGKSFILCDIIDYH